jgi:hypothetical protein
LVLPRTDWLAARHVPKEFDSFKAALPEYPDLFVSDLTMMPSPEY